MIQDIQCFRSIPITIAQPTITPATIPIILENVPTDALPVLEIKKPRKFVPIDGSAITQISKMLQEQKIIDSDWNPTCKEDMSFALDAAQQKILESALNNEISFEYKGSACTFTLASFIKHFCEKNRSSIESVFLIGGIGRFLFCSSLEFCALILNEAGAKIPLEIIQNLLLNHLYSLPDIDVRFKLKTVDPLEKEAVLEQHCNDLVDFLHMQFKKQSVYIPTSTINEFGLKKRQPVILEGLAYSIIGFGKAQFAFSSCPSWMECMFVLEMKTTHLFPRDNLQIDVLPYLCASEKTPETYFCSYEKKQFKAGLHILLKKIALEHEIDFNGLIRVISLLTTGNTLINSLGEFLKRFSFFSANNSTNGFLTYCSKALLKCMDNHHPHALEAYSLLLYNLASMLDKKTRDIYLIPIWKRVSAKMQEKNLKLLPVSDLFTELICEKQVPFELVEAVTGLAATLHLCHIDAKSESPATLLCENGKEVFLQIGLGKEYNSCYLLVPFRPDLFLQRLSEKMSQENAALLAKLFFELRNFSPESKCSISLLEAYFPQFPEVFDSLFWAVSNVDENAGPLLPAIAKEFEKSLQIANLQPETFFAIIEEAASNEQRVLVWKKLCHAQSGAPLGKLLKNSEKRWVNLLSDPAKKNKAARFWIYVLIQTGDMKLIELALQLCAKDHQKYRLFSLEFCQQLLPLLYTHTFSSAQRLIRIVQKKQGQPFPLQEEFQIVSGMLDTLQKRSSRACALPEVVSSISILECFVNRCETETSPSLNFSESATAFLERIFYEGFYSEAKSLLQRMTQLGLISPKDQKVKDLWVGSYAVESTKQKAASIESYRLWKEGFSHKIWESEVDCEVFLEAMTKTLEALGAIDPYENQFIEMACGFKPSKKSKELFGNRIEICLKKALDKHLENGQEKSLETVQKRIIDFKEHLGHRTKQTIMLSLFEAHLPLKLWARASKIWGSLMNSKQLDMRLEAIGTTTEKFIGLLLRNRQFPLIAALLPHPQFHKVQALISGCWMKNSAAVFHFLHQCRTLISTEMQFSISKEALKGISLLDIEQQQKFLAKTNISEFCDKEQLSKQVADLVVKLMAKGESDRQIEECLHLLDGYRPQEGAAWVSVFERIETFGNPARAWKLAQVALGLIPQEEADAKFKCVKGAVLCLIKNESPILIEFFNELLATNSAVNATLDNPKNFISCLELFPFILNSMTALFQKKLISCERSNQVLTHILSITKKFREEKEWHPLYLSVLFASINYSLTTREFELFIQPVNVIFDLLMKDPTIVPIETIFRLLKEGLYWQNQPEFGTSGAVGLLGKIVRLIVFSTDKEEFIKGNELELPEPLLKQKNKFRDHAGIQLAHIISSYQSDEMTRVTSNLLVYILVGRYLSTGEMLKDLQNFFSRIDQAIPFDPHKKLVLEKKNLHVQADTKLGKILVRHIKKLSGSTKGEDIVTAAFLLRQDVLSEHLCLSSMSSLKDAQDEIEFHYFQKGAFSAVHVKRLLETAQKFVEDPDLLRRWRRKIFNRALCFIDSEYSSDIFYAGFCLLFSQLAPARCNQSVTCEKKISAQNVPVYALRLSTPESPERQFMEHQKENCRLMLEFLEIILERYNIAKNVALQTFVGENLGSVMDFIYHYRLKNFETAKLAKVIDVYMADSANIPNLMDFWNKTAVRHDFPLVFGELFIPTIMDLLNTNTVLAQTKAYCALHIIVVGEGKFPGFPLEVVDKLYKTAFSGLFTLLKHYPLDDVKNLFNSFKLLLTGIRETGNLSRELKKHSQLMEKFSLQFLEALIASALDEKRTGIQSFQILTFVCLSTWDFQQLQTVSPLSEKYSAVVGTLIFQMTQKVSWMQNCASEDILKLTDSLINIIIKELKSQKQPNEPFLLLVKNWFFAFKTITDGNTVKIANEHATRFNKQISEHYTEEIYNKYVVVYT